MSTSDYTAGGAIGAVPLSTEPHQFDSVAGIEPRVLLEGLTVRPVSGDTITMALVEMAPGLTMPEHRHVNEQVGIVVRGEFTFTVGGETRVRRPGDSWVIPAGVPHAVAGAGHEGCTLIETFSPVRGDWEDKPTLPASPGRWP